MIRAMWVLLPADKRRRFAVDVALTVLSALTRAVGTVLLVPLVAALFTTTPAQALPWLAGLTVCIVVGWLLDARAASIGFTLGFALLDDVQHGVADRLTRVPLDWFTADRTATARQAIATAGPDLVGLFAYLLTPLVQALLLPVAIGLALLPIAWQLGVAALAGVPALLGAMWAAGRITRRADRVAADTNVALTERLLEFARTQQALRAARRVDAERSHAGSAIAAQHGATTRLLLLQVPGQLLFGLAAQLALVLLAGTAAALAVGGSIGVPEAIPLLVVLARYLEPFTALGALTPALETTRSTMSRLREVLTAPVSERTRSAPAAAGAAPAVQLREVTFGYGDASPVIEGFSVDFEPGSITAVVGPSGSGKSTILGLIAGLHEPDAGRVLIDGVEDAGTSTSVVFQHPYLFDGTIAENVRAGDPRAGDDRVLDAIILARVDEIAERLPAGLDTVVGEGGTALSGGERQRVSIARALLKPAPVLLIDEATSALDTENEAAVMGAVASARPGDGRPRTRIVVAHRLTTIRGADRVLFVEDGRIVEDGSVADLQAAGGRFADFWRRQEEAAGWRLTAEPAGPESDQQIR